MSIYPDRKDGKLTGRFRVEVTLDGRRLRKRFDTFEQAQAAEKELTRQLKSGEVIPNRNASRTSPVTLLELLRKGAKLIWGESGHGVNAYRQVEYIAAWRNDPKLDAITTETIDALILHLRSEGKSPGTINRYLSALHRLLRWGNAHGRDYVKRMPVFDWQDEDEGRIRCLTHGEEQAVIGLLRGYGQNEIADFVSVALDTGCRRGELLAVEPKQLRNAWLHLLPNQTKTSVARSVPLTARSKAILETRLPWSIKPHQLRHFWNKAKEAMRLGGDEDFVLHACRHTCATRLIEAGVNLAVVQKYLGHKNIQTTLRYAHVSDALLSDAAVRLMSHQDINLRKEQSGARNSVETLTPQTDTRRTG